MQTKYAIKSTEAHGLLNIGGKSLRKIKVEFLNLEEETEVQFSNLEQCKL
jgi:hypothetical protein